MFNCKIERATESFFINNVNTLKLIWQLILPRKKQKYKTEGRAKAAF